MKKKYIVMLGGVLLLAGAGLGLLFGSIDMNQISRMLEDIPHGLREILMIVLIAAQIFLAFLPGEPLELAAGFLFGSVGGTLLCLVGSLLGTALVYLLVQRYGKRLVTVFFKQEQLNEFTGVLKKRNSMLWIFLLFLIPGTPKDIMTYVVSLSISLWEMAAAHNRGTYSQHCDIDISQRFIEGGEFRRSCRSGNTYDSACNCRRLCL